MSLTYLKNKVTGELKSIEAGSREYLDLVAQRLSDHKDDDGNTPFSDQAHQPLWEDRGVAGHAEAGEQPAVGNVNDRAYDDALVGAQPELGIDPDLTPLSGSDREVHAKVHDSGTTALDGRDEGSGPVKAAPTPQAPPPAPAST